MTAALALVLAAAVVAPDIKVVEDRLAREKAAAERLAQKETSVLEALAQAQNEVAGEAARVKAAEKKAKAARAAQDAATVREADAQAALQRDSDAIAPRLRARYRLGREGYFRLLVAAPSIGDLLQRRRLFDAVLKSDLALLDQLRWAADGAKSAREALEAARRDAEASIDAEKERRAALAERHADEERLLVVIRSQRALHEKTAAELEAAREALQRQLDKIPISPPGPIDFTTLKGKLVWPATGRVEVRFGKVIDPRFHTISVQKGIDLRAPAGAPVQAVAPGKIVHAGWFRGYGNLVIVDHGGGYYTLFAHLGEMSRAVGDHVVAGDRLGEVGDTGSLKGAYLYFEIRQQQKPLDPARWLVRRR